MTTSVKIQKLFLVITISIIQRQYPLIFMCGEKKCGLFGLRGMILPSMGIDDMTIFRKVM